MDETLPNPPEEPPKPPEEVANEEKTEFIGNSIPNVSRWWEQIEVKPGITVPFFKPLLLELEAMRDYVRDDHDLVILITGNSGVGKSVLAMQMAAYLDPKFSTQRIIYTREDFEDRALNIPKRSSIILDESRGLLGGDHAGEKGSKIMLDLLDKLRQRNLYQFFLIPDFFEFRPKIAVNKSHYLIKVFERGNLDWKPKKKGRRHRVVTRGHARCYNKKQKHFAYYQGKRMGHKFPFMHGTLEVEFRHVYPIPEDEYRQMKEDDLRYRFEREREEKEKEAEEARKKAEREKQKDEGPKMPKLAKAADDPVYQLFRLNSEKDDAWFVKEFPEINPIALHKRLLGYRKALGLIKR